MVDFKTIDGSEVKFGNNDFIQVSRKKAVSEDGENVFVSLSRGFFGENDERVWKKNFSIPDDDEVLEAVIDALQELRE